MVSRELLKAILLQQRRRIQRMEAEGLVIREGLEEIKRFLRPK